MQSMLAESRTKALNLSVCLNLEGKESNRSLTGGGAHLEFDYPTLTSIV